MNTLLVVNSSPRSQSVSRKLTGQFARDWKAASPENTVIERDLSGGGLPFLDEAWIDASYTPAAQRTAAQSQLLALSDKLIDEVLAADVIVLGIPMHNFSVPASFKAWIDQIARAGKTFSYTDKGPKGLIPSDKKVVALLSRGGTFTPDGVSGGGDLQVAYLRQILGFIGFTDITFVHADQQGMGGQAATLAAEKAGEQLTSILRNCPTQQPA